MKLSGRFGRLGFGALNLLLAAFLAVCVFRLLPARWWVVDGGAGLIIAALGASGLMLLANARYARVVTRAAAALTLLLGLGLFAILLFTASWLAGVYGPIGRGGATLFAIVAALAFPYLVVFPAVLLAWAGRTNEAA